MKRLYVGLFTSTQTDKQTQKFLHQYDPTPSSKKLPPPIIETPTRIWKFFQPPPTVGVWKKSQAPPNGRGGGCTLCGLQKTDFDLCPQNLVIHFFQKAISYKNPKSKEIFEKSQKEKKLRPFLYRPLMPERIFADFKPYFQVFHNTKTQKAGYVGKWICFVTITLRR